MTAQTRRYLTKSRFKLAGQCPTKLNYTKKPEYVNQSVTDDFLRALAEGGILVGELAKHYFPHGRYIDSLDYDKAIEETKNLLKQDHVTIFEAALATEDLLVRVDVLVKDGNNISLYEVKSKSIRLDTDEPLFRGKRGDISASWLPYLEDISFQQHVAQLALPEYNVTPHLMLVNKSVIAETDGLHQKFLLRRDHNGYAQVELTDAIIPEDLKPALLTKIDVSGECEEILVAAPDIDDGLSFTERINLYAASYTQDKRLPPSLTKACKTCEFEATDEQIAQGLRSGKRECFGQMLGWIGQDYERQTVLNISNFRKADKLIDAGVVDLDDVGQEDIGIKPSKSGIGLSSSERQWLQVEKYQKRDTSSWIDAVGLKAEMDSWTYPLHFIDFETVRPAIPFNKGDRPYEAIAFQFSHHTVDKDGDINHAGQYLNREQGVFPNFTFAKQLQEQLSGDDGSVFIYSQHENSFLNEIHEQLMVRDIEPELQAFIRTLTKSPSKSQEQWSGDRLMVDMLKLVKSYYYSPITKGSNSIKQVLPAVLGESKYLQDFYSTPNYGTEQIPSLNFSNHQWLQHDAKGDIVDPYKQLPQLFTDFSDDQIQLLLTQDDALANGGAAMCSYAKMQYTQMSEAEEQELANALLKYCELDTLAMVMIYQHWSHILGTNSAS